MEWKILGVCEGEYFEEIWWRIWVGFTLGNVRDLIGGFLDWDVVEFSDLEIFRFEKFKIGGLGDLNKRNGKCL